MPHGLEASTLHQLDEIFRSRKRLARKDSLYRAGEAFSALYAVRSGTCKTLMRGEDGREQVTGFYGAGDVLGADGIAGNRHVCEAIALEDTEVSVIGFAQFDRLAADNPELRRSLYRCIARDATRGQEMMLLLGAMCAEERLVTFLLDLAHQHEARGYSMTEFTLRMSREELASYIGLKIETVSRLFSRLQEAGLLQVQGRAIKLLDPPALRRLASGRG